MQNYDTLKTPVRLKVGISILLSLEELNSNLYYKLTYQIKITFIFVINFQKITQFISFLIKKKK